MNPGTGEEAMNDQVKGSKTLLDGHRRFVRYYLPGVAPRLRALADGQQPSTMYIGCADSRVVPNLFLDAGPGELFVIRHIASIVPLQQSPAALGLGSALEYALGVLKVSQVVVCGHDACGGFAHLLHSSASTRSQATKGRAAAESPRGKEGAQPPVDRLNNSALSVRHCSDADGHSGSQIGSWLAEAGLSELTRARLRALPRQRAIEEFVLLQLGRLASYRSVVGAIDAGKLTIAGWVYDLAAGRLRVLGGDGRFHVQEPAELADAG
jgi:carbonic anhydrase